MYEEIIKMHDKLEKKTDINEKKDDLPLSFAAREEFDKYIENGDKIGAIKVLREQTNLGLKECKMLVETYYPEVGANNSEGCYVATAVYGSYDCPEVWTLRRFRDMKLKRYCAGRAFIHFYYMLSPKLVLRFGNVRLFPSITKKLLDPFVAYLNSHGYESTQYVDLR